jgi:hypothetical protein
MKSIKGTRVVDIRCRDAHDLGELIIDRRRFTISPRTAAQLDASSTVLAAIRVGVMTAPAIVACRVCYTLPEQRGPLLHPDEVGRGVIDHLLRNGAAGYTRRTPRFPVRLHAGVRRGSSELIAPVVEVSLLGATLLLPDELAIGTELTLEMRAAAALPLSGRVAARNAQQRSFIHYLATSDESWRQLRRTIRRSLERGFLPFAARYTSVDSP